MITLESIKDVENELKRFNKRLEEAKSRLRLDGEHYSGTKETGALRRSAMDLKRELTKLTK